MDQIRRSILKECGAGGAVALAAVAGLLLAPRAAAAPRNAQGFAARTLAEALASLGATDAIQVRS